MSLILVILAIIIIATILIAVILNPIRLRIRASHSVFEVEATEEDIRRCFDEAVAAEDWNLAYVWAYRLMVVGLDECEVVSATPGLTAREAAVAATRVVPDHGDRTRPSRTDVRPRALRAFVCCRAGRQRAARADTHFVGSVPKGAGSRMKATSTHVVTPTARERASAARPTLLIIAFVILVFFGLAALPDGRMNAVPVGIATQRVTALEPSRRFSRSTGSRCVK